MITALIDKGLVKLSDFKESSQKIKYSYFLTPKGIREKSLLTHSFLIRKKKEYETLRNEIIQLEQEIGIKPTKRNSGNGRLGTKIIVS